MRKKILMMVGAFIAGGATVTGVRKFLKMKEGERFASWYEEEEEEPEDLDFDEDLDLDFDLEGDEEQIKRQEQKLETIVKEVCENRIVFTEEQINKIQNAVKRRIQELKLINSLYGEVTADE